MMNCLNEARIQAVADGEGTEAEHDHVRICTACGVRVTDARDATGDFGHLMSDLRVPPMLGTRVASALQATERRGATTLRAVPRPPHARRGWIVAGGALAAAMIAMVFVLLPSVDPRTTLNAAEILDRSLQTLRVQGIERLAYELSIDTPAGATIEGGTYRIEQLIDHNTGRFRFARFATDGTLLNGIAENPATGVREIVMKSEGRTYRFRFTIAADRQVRLWDLQRRYAESMIRLVQASTGQIVRVEEQGDRRLYVVELPDAAVAASPSLFDLTRARVVVDAADYHIVEFAAAGAVMGERVSIGYRLLERLVGRTLDPMSAFDLPQDDGAAIVIEGEGTKHVPRDLLGVLLAEVAKTRR